MQSWAAADRKAHLEDLYWEAWRAARYRKWGVNTMPAGLDADERAIYDSGLAAGDSDRRAA